MSALIASLPLATRGLTGALVGFSVLLAVLRLTMTEQKLHFVTWSKDDSALSFPWLVLVPGQSFMYPWTLLTSSFCETTVFEFILSLVTLPLFGRYLERIWGGAELVKFAVVVLVGSNIIAWFLAIVQFAVLGSDYAIFGTQYHGLTALQAGFLVALTQLIPEHQLQIFNGRLKIQVKGLPMAYVTVSTVLTLVGLVSPWILIQFGWLISWAWLRFFKMNEAGFRGDRSETFSFVNWFPPFAHKPVTLLSNLLFKIFTRLHIVQPWQYSDIETGPNASHAPTGPSRAEAERRRAMALKALDQKVARGPGSGSRLSRGNSNVGSSSAGASSSRANGDDYARSAADDKHLDDTKEADGLLKLDAEDEGDLGAASR